MSLGGKRSTSEGDRIRIWDLPTRLGHWLLVLLVAASWLSAETGRMEWHTRSGLALLAVLLFRLYWGVVGSATARFSRFVRGPAVVLAYARRLLERPQTTARGHNPLAGWGSVALLGLLLLQAALGLFAVDVDGVDSGPLARLVSFETGRRVADLHETTFQVLLGAIVLHLAALAFYLLYRRENLIPAMVRGFRRRHAAAAAAAEAEEEDFAPLWRAIPGLVLAGLVVFLLTRN